MAVTDTDATERVEPEPVAAQDPIVSPVVDHSAAHLHSPVPKVAHHVPAPAPAPAPTRSRTGRRAASSWPRSAGPAIGCSAAWLPPPG